MMSPHRTNPGATGPGAPVARPAHPERRRARGVAMIELALVLPVLVLLVLGAIDFSRMIQFNNVLISLTREGANLAARSTEQPQVIAKTLMDTAQPLQMNRDGMMYITKLVGESDGRARVDAQYKPAGGGAANLPSELWSCRYGWSAGACIATGPLAARDRIQLAVPLGDGETVYAVEALYRYTLFTRYVLSSDPRLASMTIL